jgi:Flp pilus assembly protein TadB
MVKRGEGSFYSTMCHGFARALGRNLKTFKKQENESASPELKNALKFTGSDVEPWEVALLAYTVTAIVLVILMGIDVVILVVFPMSFTGILMFIVLPTVAIPLSLLSLLATYPKIRARRIRNRSLGRMPEAINYLSMSMRLNPALDRAVSFAADNLDEPLSSGMRSMLWDVYLRKHHSIEDAFVQFSYDWGDWNEDFKRALYAIRSAELEKTREGLDRGLDKASEIILTGTKRRMEQYAASLSGPTFILFSMGIVLPMILGAMLPMMAVGGVNLGALEIAVLLDVAFPLVTFGYAYSILGKRPGTAPPPNIPEKKSAFRRAGTLAAIAGIVLALPGIPPIASMLGLGYLPMLWAVGGAVGVYCLLASRKLKRERDLVKKMEAEFPDALFQLGSRISEGKPLEAALSDTAGSMAGTEIAKLFEKIAGVLRLTRAGLGEALFSKHGIMKNFPSRTISASMKTVVEVVGKDTATAGRTIIGISNYLRDMNKVDHEIRTRLGSVMDMMRSTAMIFAPVVMGVTAALYFVMASVLGGLEESSSALSFGGAATLVPRDVFTLILGVYLFLTVVTIMYFVSGMKEGDDPIELKWQIGTALPVALSIFSLAALIGGGLVG